MLRKSSGIIRLKSNFIESYSNWIPDDVKVKIPMTQRRLLTAILKRPFYMIIWEFKIEIEHYLINEVSKMRTRRLREKEKRVSIENEPDNL